MSGRWIESTLIAALAGCAAGSPPAEERPPRHAVRTERSPAASAASVTDEVGLAVDMAEAARRFLSALTPEQRRRAVFPLGADERLAWHYIPKERRGVSLGELGDAQRHLADGLVATALSRRGLVKASAIMSLEEVLRRRARGASGLVRDPRRYFVSVFGEPSASATWGWRLEGHHLSINLTLVGGVHPVAAPTFLGAAPARTDRGDFLAETRVLGAEEELGLRLVASLDAAQRRQAVHRATAPADILTGPGERLTALPGLPASRMSAAQRKMLDAIIDEALGNLPAEIASRERARIAAAGADEIVFTWAGASSLTEPHYYRVSGPTFLYELDNTQDHANHVHTVWHAREPDGDFGLDILREHHRAAHAVAPKESPPIRSEWARAVEPFHLVGNIYYVGGDNIASYLIATSRGLILLDTGPCEMVPVVRAGIVKLGFRLEDVAILLVSHAHWDHVEGLAAMKKLTGARVMAMAEEVPALSTGKDLSALGELGWDPVPIDRVLHHGDDVVLGDTTMHALLTAGHTQGCTTWTTTARENGRAYSVAIVCVPQANAGVKLVGNPRHPTIADDLLRSYRVLKALKPDIFLDGHPQEMLAGKIDRLRAGASPNPLVDAAGYARYVAECEADTLQRLRAEKAGAGGR
jgi:glyoxylase-like metal-dependent hydrolase (beta-lactamase superfamily II)